MGLLLLPAAARIAGQRSATLPRVAQTSEGMG